MDEMHGSFHLKDRTQSLWLTLGLAFPTAHGHGNHGLQLKTLFTKFAAPKRMSGTNVYTGMWDS